MSKFFKWRTVVWVVAFLGLWVFASWWHLGGSPKVHDLLEMDEEFSRRPYLAWKKYVGKTLRMAGNAYLRTEEDSGEPTETLWFMRPGQRPGNNTPIAMATIPVSHISQPTAIYIIKLRPIVVFDAHVVGWDETVGLLFRDFKFIEALELPATK